MLITKHDEVLAKIMRTQICGWCEEYRLQLYDSGADGSYYGCSEPFAMNCPDTVGQSSEWQDAAIWVLREREQAASSNYFPKLIKHLLKLEIRVIPKLEEGIEFVLPELEELTIKYVETEEGEEYLIGWIGNLNFGLINNFDDLTRIYHYIWQVEKGKKLHSAFISNMKALGLIKEVISYE